jgi:hypothetical protein
MVELSSFLPCPQCGDSQGVRIVRAQSDKQLEFASNNPSIRQDYFPAASNHTYERASFKLFFSNFSK